MPFFLNVEVQKENFTVYCTKKNPKFSWMLFVLGSPVKQALMPCFQKFLIENLERKPR